MQLSKKIFFSLLVTINFLFFALYLWGAIDATVQNNPNKQEDLIGYGVIWGIFSFASLSSLFWLIKFGEKFGILKIPALIFLPLSVPFLILDFCCGKKGISTQQQSKTKNKQGPVLVVVLLLNLIIVFIYLGLVLLLGLLSNGLGFLLFIPFAIAVGSGFLMLDYFYPHKIFKGLSFLGLVFNWFYLLFDFITQKELYFFCFKKIKSTDSVEQVSSLSSSEDQN